MPIGSGSVKFFMTKIRAGESKCPKRDAAAQKRTERSRFMWAKVATNTNGSSR
jgi:hypothetical protein